MIHFGQQLAIYLARRGLTGTAFAKLAGISKGWPSNLQSGKQKPPNDETTLTKWASVLELNDVERDGFIDLALLEHTPERIRKKLVALEAAASRGPKRVRP